MATAACLAGTAGVMLSVAYSERNRVGTSIVLASLSIVIAAVAVAVAAARGRGIALGRFRLASWYPLLFALSFGLTSVSWRHAQSGSPAVIEQSSVVTALIYALFALAGWGIGYMSGPGRSARRIVAVGLTRLLGTGLPSLRTPRTALILYVTGWFGRLLRFATGHYGYLGDASVGVASASGFGQPIALLELCTRFALVVAAIDVVWSGGRRSRITLTILLVIEIAVGLFSGMKSEFVLTILGLVVVATAARMRLPKRWVILAVLAFMILLAFNEQYRSQVRTSGYSLSPAQAAPLVPSVLAETIQRTSARTLFIDGPTKVSKRLREIDNVAIIVQKTPADIPYVGLRPMIEAPVLGVVPRLLWPGKPLFTAGYQFSQQYYGLNATTYSSSAPTPVGDLYRHVGLFGMVVGMFVLGAACRLVDDQLHPFIDLRLAVLFVPLFAALMNIEIDAVAAIASLPLLLAQSVLICRLAFRTPRVAS